MTELRKTSLVVPNPEVETSPKSPRRGFRETIGGGIRDVTGGLRDSVGGLLEPLRLRSNSASKLDKVSSQTSPNLARKSDGAEPARAVDDAMKDALSAIENLKAGALERTTSGDKKSGVVPKLEATQSAPTVATAKGKDSIKSLSSEGAGTGIGFVHSQRVRADAVNRVFDKYGVDFLFMAELHAMEEMPHPELDLTYWEVAAAVFQKTLEARQTRGLAVGDAEASEVYHSVMTLQKAADLGALIGLHTAKDNSLQPSKNTDTYRSISSYTDVGSVVVRWMGNSAVEYTLPSYVPVSQVAERFRKCIFLLKVENTSCDTCRQTPEAGSVLVSARVGDIAHIRLHLVHRGNTDTIYHVDVRLINDPWAHLLPESLRPRPTLDADRGNRFRDLNEFIGNEFNVIVAVAFRAKRCEPRVWAMCTAGTCGAQVGTATAAAAAAVAAEDRAFVWPNLADLQHTDFIGIEFWLSFTTTLILLGSPWLLYILWRTHEEMSEQTLDELQAQGPAKDISDRPIESMENDDGSQAHQPPSQCCKIVPNPMHLFRGAEYNRYSQSEGKEALTPYDKSLATRDQQAIFCNEMDACGDKALEIAHIAMMTGWQETDPQQRIQLANDALAMSENCAGAFILLAEESAPTVDEARELLVKSVDAAERQLLRVNPNYFTQHANAFWMKPETRPYVYAKRRLGICLSKFGRHKEAVKIFKDILNAFPSVACSHLNVQANLIEALLALGMYSEVQYVIDKYESSMGKSALLYYTIALLRIRQCSDGFSLEMAADRGLSMEELIAIDTLNLAIEFNPHVPKYLLEQASLVLPPEHVALRGDSEAVAYAFDHLRHWKACKGALELLHVSYESFKGLSNPENGIKFEPYPRSMEMTDRRLLPDHHHVSVFPEKAIPLVLVVGVSVALVVFFLLLPLLV